MQRAWIRTLAAWCAVVPLVVGASTQSFSSSGTWIAPAGVTSVTVEAWGAGGAGGGATGNPSQGGGGAGGQYARKVQAVTPGNSYAIVVGAGGVGGTTAGAAGGDSTFGGTLVVAKGGAGGVLASGNNTVGAGGVGAATGGVGTTVYAGGSGAAGVAGTTGGAGGGGAGSAGSGGNASGATAGTGASVGGGAGAAGRTSSGSCTNAATVAGGGGCGAYAGNATDRSGGDGAGGSVTLTYQVPPSGTTQAATSITVSGARLNATVDALDASASVSFEYGLTTAYGSSVNATPFAISAGTTGSAVVADLTGLSPNTLYHFRVKVVSALGTTYGSDLTFTTLGPTLTKTASAGAGRVGDVITFSIVYNNPLATDILNATVTDVLPSGMTYSNAAPTMGTVGVSGQTVTWSIPIIPAGGSAQLTLAVGLVNQGVLTNTVTAPNASSGSASVLVLAGAVTHYRMDEPVGAWNGTTGEVLDSGTTGLHGKRVLSGASTTTNVIAPSPTIAAQNTSVVGGFCNAGRFDGNAVVEVPANALFGYTTQLSASAWIYLTAYPGSGLYSVLSNDVNYEFHVDSSGKLYWWWNYSTLTSSASIPLNQWTHVAITFSSASGAGRQRIYINGVRDPSTNNWTGTLQQNNCKFYVGGDVATGAACDLIPARNFRGNIDEVKLYNYELTAAEVQADMTLGRNCSGTYDHIRIEHDGAASVCTPETVTIKACLNSSCTSLYTGAVTVQLTPSGWTGGDTFTFSGGVTTRSLGMATPGAVTLGVASASPLAANSAKCYNGSTQTCGMTFAAASCNFDAVEVGANPKTRLFTKLAGTGFNVDILALTGSSVNTSINSAVDVDLVDSSSADCPSGAGLMTPQSVTLVNGRKTATFNYAQARPNVRVRMKQGSSAAACSTDNFAIRPQGFTVSSSNANADAAGTNATATPRIKTGASFTLTADTSTPGYGGTPTLDATKRSAHTGAAQTGTLAGSFTTAAASGTGNGASGAAFSYSEVGYFRLTADAVTDSSFTAVDNTVGDCVVGSSSNTLVGGKYGCNIGSTQSSYFGRFIPDRFVTVVTPACGSGTLFSYAGQPFTVQVTAQNSSGTTTQNYQGSSWAKAVTLSSALAAPSGIACFATPCTGVAALSSASIAASSFAIGVASASPSYGYQNTAVGAASTYAMAAPYTLQVRAIDTDTVTSSGFTEGSTSVRSGRVRLFNAYGSERLDLPMTMRSEHWSGGWQPNAADTCTTTNLSFADVSGPPNFSNNTCVRDSGNPGASGRGCAAAGVATRRFREAGVAGFAGDFNLWLQAPLLAGSMDVTAAVSGWLQFPWAGAAVANPSARATFGVYKSPLIYRRENY